MALFVLQSQNFDMWQTFKSKQTLRWRVVNDNDCLSYIISHRDKICLVKQQNHGRILFTGSEEDFYDVWFPYFNCQLNYADLNALAAHSLYPISIAAKQAKGVHLLSIDPWECVLENILWYRCSYTTARKRINSICQAIGIKHHKSFKGFGSITWYEVPSPDDILDNQEMLEWFCDHEMISLCASAAVWFKVFLHYLTSSEDTIKYDHLMHYCKQSKLMTKLQAERIARNGFSIQWPLCIPRKWKKRIDSERLREKFSCEGYPMGYLGAILSSKSDVGGVELWG